MRLWHQNMIPYLSRQHLLGQHRECCALRGKSWGKKHSTVDYVFRYSPRRLFEYHLLIMQEMQKRGYKVAPEWLHMFYRGKNCGSWHMISEDYFKMECIFPEHNNAYLYECIENLKNKDFDVQPFEILLNMEV